MPIRSKRRLIGARIAVLVRHQAHLARKTTEPSIRTPRTPAQGHGHIRSKVPVRHGSRSEAAVGGKSILGHRLLEHAVLEELVRVVPVLFAAPDAAATISVSMMAIMTIW